MSAISMESRDYLEVSLQSNNCFLNDGNMLKKIEQIKNEILAVN